MSHDTIGEELNHVTLNWRARECRCSSATRVFPVVFTFEQCSTIEWTSLHNIKFCTISVLLNKQDQPCGVRIYLVPSQISDLSDMANPQFLALESILAMSLTNEYRYASGSEKGTLKRKKISLDEHTIEVPETFHVSKGIYWEYRTKSFTDTPQEASKITMKQSFLVSSILPGWQETVLQYLPVARNADPEYKARSLVLPNCCLVITKKPQEWLDSCKKLDIKAACLDPSGLDPNSDVRVIVSSEEALAAAFTDELNFVDLVDFASTFYMDARTDIQLKRLILYFSKKLRNFKVPLSLCTFGSVILEDDCAESKNFVHENSGLKWINIYKDDSRAVPTTLSKQQKKTICLESAWNRVCLENYLSIIPVQKAILRKIKIHGKEIKNGAIETRIASYFRDTFCPLPFADALERFSGRAMTFEVAKRLIHQHFDTCEITLADFSKRSVQTSNVNSSFVMSALEVEPKACTICFEDIGGLYGVTLCGHVYCTECILRHFQPAWTAFEPKECAHCRTNLISGDLFHIDPSLDAYAPSLPSKLASVKDFISYFKTPVTTWPNLNSRHVIIEDLTKCSVKQVIQAFQDLKQTINVYVFYSASEVGLFKEFQQQFI